MKNLPLVGLLFVTILFSCKKDSEDNYISPSYNYNIIGYLYDSTTITPIPNHYIQMTR